MIPRSCPKNGAQRQRDDNINKICAFEGGGPRGQRGKSSKNAVFRGKRHDNKILKLKILLWRNFVVVAQAPKCPKISRKSFAYLVPAPKARLYRKVLVAKCLPGWAEGPYQGQLLSPRKCSKKALSSTSLESTFERQGTFGKCRSLQKEENTVSRDTFQGRLAVLQIGAFPPPWYLVSHRHICAIPHFATYRAIIVRCPRQTSTKNFCDTIAASIARYEKYRYWASNTPPTCSACKQNFNAIGVCMGGIAR